MFKSDSIDSFLDYAVGVLTEAGMENPRHDAVYILSESAGVSIPELETLKKEPVSPEVLESALEALRRRSWGEPLQYIFGRAYFRNLVLEVNSSVLIPRPETEIMVDIALKQAPFEAGICDIGTGSGAVAISLARERKDLSVTAADISADALETAAMNRERYRLKNLKLVRSDLFEALDGKFDVITANLPYVPDQEYSRLPDEIRNFEPESALRGGHDGLACIRRMLERTPEHLEDGGSLVVEFGKGQEKELEKIFSASGAFAGVKFEKDLTDTIRFAVAEKKR